MPSNSLIIIIYEELHQNANIILEFRTSLALL